MSSRRVLSRAFLLLVVHALGFGALAPSAGAHAVRSAAPLQWTAVAPSPQARFEAQGAVVGSRLFVFGGFYNSAIQVTLRSDVYDATTDAWARIPDMPQGLTHAPAVVHGDDIYLVGGLVGDDPGSPVRNVWRYDTATSVWSAAPPLPAPRGAGGAAIVGSTIHFFGGNDRRSGGGYVDVADHWALDLSAPDPRWVAQAPLPEARNHLGAAGFGGKVYAVGGQHGRDEQSGNQARVDVYDPGTDRWSRAANLPDARGHLTSSVFPVGDRLLAIGGTENGNVASGKVTEYDAGSNTWTALTPLPSGRKTPVAGYVGDRLVASTGGPRATVETWTAHYARPPLPGPPPVPGPPPLAPPPLPAPTSGPPPGPPPGAASPGPSAAPPPATPDAVALTPALSGSAGAGIRPLARTLRLRGRRITVRLSCPASAAATAGTLIVRSSMTRSRTRPPSRTLGRATFRCSGPTATAGVRVSARHRRRIARLGAIRAVAVAVARPETGNRLTTRTAVVVRAR